MSRENDIATAVMRIAAAKQDGVATFRRCYREVPDHVRLTRAECDESQTRPGEPMWHQLVRNIQSHHDVDGNFVAGGLLEHVPRVGYRITQAGRAWLARR